MSDLSKNVSSRSTFRDQMVGTGAPRGSRVSSLMPMTMQDKFQLAVEIENATDRITSTFESQFAPSDMRQLALVAHNHMKPAMREFIETYSDILKKFRITGTQTTMRMCKSLWGEDNPDIEYGLTCTSGPLGGDAQIAALMCMEDLGALIFFIDPLSAHPHQADIDSLIRLANCSNVIVCPNPTSAMSMIQTFKCALEQGNRGIIPSFFETLESPAVEEYKDQQECALAAAVAGTSFGRPMLLSDPSAYFPPAQETEKVEEDGDTGEDLDDYDSDEVLDMVQQFQGQIGLNETYHAPSGDKPRGRGSHLSGMKVEDPSKRKKKRSLVKKMVKSMRRLGLELK